MPLMKLSQYRQKHFVEGSRPTLRTLKRWIVDGEIEGEVIGSNYYVRVGEIKPVNHLVTKVLKNDTQAQKAR
jgi:hypothetical protein